MSLLAAPSRPSPLTRRSMFSPRSKWLCIKSRPAVRRLWGLQLLNTFPLFWPWNSQCCRAEPTPCLHLPRSAIAGMCHHARPPSLVKGKFEAVTMDNMLSLTCKHCCYSHQRDFLISDLPVSFQGWMGHESKFKGYCLHLSGLAHVQCLKIYLQWLLEPLGPQRISLWPPWHSSKPCRCSSYYTHAF